MVELAEHRSGTEMNLAFSGIPEATPSTGKEAGN